MDGAAREKQNEADKNMADEIIAEISSTSSFDTNSLTKMLKARTNDEE